MPTMPTTPAMLSSLRALSSRNSAIALRLGALSVVALLTSCLCSYEDADGLPPPPKPAFEKPKPVEAAALVQGEKGEPSIVGCADGQREGFADHRKFPNIAGCLARWSGDKNLRTPPTTRGCGDDADRCISPADVCAEGWHICAASGLASDLSDRVDAQGCAQGAGPGKFVAAMSHGQTQTICPPKPSPTTNFPCWEKGICAEPVCCGQGCELAGCRDAVWPAQTRISRGTAEGCGAVRAQTNGGILCCRDEILAAAPEPTSSDAATPTGAESGRTTTASQTAVDSGPTSTK